MPVTAAAVSGGVDSLYALLSLSQSGKNVIAVHGRFLPQPPETDPVPLLQKACDLLDVPLYVFDLREAFDREVVTPFIQSYAAGRTPNPCAMCNARIKLGLLADEAALLGAEFLATGHYAGFEQHPKYGSVLCAGKDTVKDQSYFLACVPRKKLERTQFPLSSIDKQTAREAVEKAGLQIPLPKESQEICFVPKDAYRPFLETEMVKRGITTKNDGPAVLPDGTEIARHRGLWCYTEGQRKGLGIAWKEPLFVLEKDMRSNALCVGPRSALGMTGCTTGKINELVPRELWPENILVRLRYRQQAMPAQVTFSDDRMHISLSEAQFPAAPGQIAAVYDSEGNVLAGAEIEAVERIKE